MSRVFDGMEGRGVNAVGMAGTVAREKDSGQRPLLNPASDRGRVNAEAAGDFGNSEPLIHRYSSLLRSQHWEEYSIKCIKCKLPI
jgi:hypothetical protein